MEQSSQKIPINFSAALCTLSWYRPKDPRTPLGLAYITAYCNKHIVFTGTHQLYLFEYDVREDLSRLVHEILYYKPKVLGLGVYCWNADATQKVLFSLRTLGYQGIIVLGGPEISYGDKLLLTEYPEANYYVRGDGEQAFTEIIRAVAGEYEPNLPGIHAHTSTDFSSLAQIPNLNLVPSPYKDETLKEHLLGKEFVRWQTQRGCYFKCSFCAFTNPQSTSREVSLDKIEVDLHFFVENGVTEVAVLDPIFFAHRKRALAILQLIEQIAQKIRFEIQTRLEHLNQEIMNKIVKLGTIVLECGVQTLDPVVQKHISRFNNHKKVMTNLQLLQKHRIPYEVHLIYGLPFQTLDSLLHDIQTLLSFTPSKLHLFPLALLKGTKLASEVETIYKHKLIFSPVFPQYVIETAWMSMEEVYYVKLLAMQLHEKMIKHEILFPAKIKTNHLQTIQI